MGERFKCPLYLGPLDCTHAPDWFGTCGAPALCLCWSSEGFAPQLQNLALLACVSESSLPLLGPLGLSVLWALPVCEQTSAFSQPAVEDPGESCGPVSLMPLLPALQQLQLLGRFCQEQGIPFPPISPSPEEQRQPRECHLFSDPDCPEAPAVLHFPLVNDSFREHSAPGELPAPPPPGALGCPSSHLFHPLCLSQGDPNPLQPQCVPSCLAALFPH